MPTGFWKRFATNFKPCRPGALHDFAPAMSGRRDHGLHNHPFGISQIARVPAITQLILSSACNNFGQKYISVPESKPGPTKSDDRIVLLGGPGQGKSTIGQFLIQFFQAQLISAPKAPGVALETIKYAKSVLESARSADEFLHRFVTPDHVLRVVTIFLSIFFHKLLKLLAFMKMAGELGFEPRFSESESDVLPLNYSPKALIRRSFCRSAKVLSL